MIEINYVMVVVAAVAAFLVGGLWYSPVLFQKRWMKLMHDDGHHKGGLTPGQAMAGEFVLTLLTSYILAHFISLIGVTTLSAALQLGFWLWLGFQAPMLFASVLFERRPIELFLINSSMRLVGIMLMAAILAW